MYGQALHHTLLASHPLDEAFSEPDGNIGHGQGDRPGKNLSFHYLGTSVLDTLGQSFEPFRKEHLEMRVKMVILACPPATELLM